MQKMVVGALSEIEKGVNVRSASNMGEERIHATSSTKIIALSVCSELNATDKDSPIAHRRGFHETSNFTPITHSNSLPLSIPCQATNMHVK